MRAALFAFVAVAILAMAGVAAYQAAETDATRSGGEEIRVVDESFSGATSGYQVAEAPSGANETFSAEHEIVVRDGDGNELDSQLYVWDSDTGTLTTYDGTDTGTVDYSVYQTTAQQDAVRSVALLPMQDAMIVFVGVFVLIGALLMLGRMV